MAAFPLLSDHDHTDPRDWRALIAQLEGMPVSEGRDEQLEWAREWLAATSDDTPENLPQEAVPAPAAPEAP